MTAQFSYSAELPMILDRELDIPPARQDIASRDTGRVTGSFRLANILVFAVLFAAVLTLQIASGAYHCEFNGYPDESAHYVTSLMVRGYITSAHPGGPVAFAQNYYAHYPKVAFGHWPPLLYVVQALWMTLFSPARAALLLELAFTTTVLAYSVYSQAKLWLAKHSDLVQVCGGVAAALLMVALPLVQTYTAEEMSETLLTLMCFWSAVFFSRYLDTERWQDSCLFGIFCALAILTKGSGWLLGLLPPIALLLTRKLRLILRPSLWAAAVIVAATCVPWQLMTMHLVEEGWDGGTHPSVAYTVSALSGFGSLFGQILGPALVALVIVGVCATVFAPMLKRPVASSLAVMFSLIVADWLFHSLVPAGVEDRKLIIAIPAMALFALAGAFWIGDRLPGPASFRRWRVPLVGVAAGIIFCVQTFAVPHERHEGYIEAAGYIAADPQLRNGTILVSSGSSGEGPFIAEIAMRQPRPTATILRGTKVLAHVSFDADVYRQLFPDAQSVLKYLRARHVDLVVLDTYKPRLNFPHDAFLRQLAEQPGLFSLVATFPAGSSANSGQVQLYRVRPDQQ